MCLRFPIQDNSPSHISDQIHLRGGENYLDYQNLWYVLQKIGLCNPVLSDYLVGRGDKEIFCGYHYIFPLQTYLNLTELGALIVITFSKTDGIPYNEAVIPWLVWIP